MESSTRTGELEPASIEPADFEPTGRGSRGEPASAQTGDTASVRSPAADMNVTTDVHPSMVAAVRDGCPVCGSAMAVDQRYCLECGERRGPPRVPLKDVPARQAAGNPPARGPRRRASMSVNTTLIAGVGCLLLALGIGVLIGRSGNGSSSKSPSVRVVTVAGAGGASTAATGETATPAATSTTAASASKSSSTHASTKSSTKAAAKKPPVPLPKPVKVGSAGHGKGYEHGHFTGNFFGGGEE
jgi:hypothetical protein